MVVNDPADDVVTTDVAIVVSTGEGIVVSVASEDVAVVSCAVVGSVPVMSSVSVVSTEDGALCVDVGPRGVVGSTAATVDVSMISSEEGVSNVAVASGVVVGSISVMSVVSVTLSVESEVPGMVLVVCGSAVGPEICVLRSRYKTGVHSDVIQVAGEATWLVYGIVYRSPGLILLSDIPGLRRFMSAKSLRPRGYSRSQNICPISTSHRPKSGLSVQVAIHKPMNNIIVTNFILG